MKSYALSDKQDPVSWNRKRGNTDGARLESSIEDRLQTPVYLRASRSRNTNQKRIRGKKNVWSLQFVTMFTFHFLFRGEIRTVCVACRPARSLSSFSHCLSGKEQGSKMASCCRQDGGQLSLFKSLGFTEWW